MRRMDTLRMDVERQLLCTTHVDGDCLLMSWCQLFPFGVLEIARSFPLWSLSRPSSLLPTSF